MEAYLFFAVVAAAARGDSGRAPLDRLQAGSVRVRQSEEAVPALTEYRQDIGEPVVAVHVVEAAPAVRTSSVPLNRSPEDKGQIRGRGDSGLE